MTQKISIVTFTLLLCMITAQLSWAQNTNIPSSENISLKEWNKKAETDKRLLPKYGKQSKIEKEKLADQQFIAKALNFYQNHKKASEQLLQMGFKYLYTDLKKAMYRFNQAYLLDSTNADIYWGYGGVYTALGDLENAEKQYKEGLTIAPENTNLLTDYGAYYMAKYQELQGTQREQNANYLDSAIFYLLKSYPLNPKNLSTNIKLSICFFEKNDCKNAWKYYQECKSIDEKYDNLEYVQALKSKCK